MYLAYFIGMLSTGVCTPRHQQTSGRLVKELNVCTVASIMSICPILYMSLVVEWWCECTNVAKYKLS